MAPAKAKLREICVANKWMLPSYECSKEEGPSHRKIFTFKVVVEIQGDFNTTLECFSSPQSTKKNAAENAAEGALWYLGQMGYFPKNK
ncbi:hypothetical protein SLE2022_381020 [Rubroshorea leprosula]